MQDETVLIIGTGNMGCAIAQGLTRSSQAPKLLLCDHNPARHADLQTRFPNAQIMQTINQMQHSAKIIILAVKPHDLENICHALATEASTQECLYLSVAAGVPCSALSSWLPAQVALVRAMPNTPAEIGLGMTGLYTATDTSTEDKTRAQSIMQTVGETLWLDSEEQLDAVTALSGSGPAYVFYFMECLQHAGVSLGLSPEQARVLTQQTLLGSAQLAQQSTAFSQLRQHVTSKGGTTEQALAALTERDLQNIIKRALSAARDRAKEMSNTYQGTS